MTDALTGGSMRVVSAGRQLSIEVHDSIVIVTTARGDRLDPAAAEVLIALGGPEPDWLGTVEGLCAVGQWGFVAEAEMVRAADVLGRKRNRRAELARTTDDPVVMLALAASGIPHIAMNPMCTPVAWRALLTHRDGRAARRAFELTSILPPQLAVVKDSETKIRVARNPECPSSILTRLASVNDEHVQAAVAANSTAPSDILRDLSEETSVRILKSVAANRCAPLDVLRSLSRHPEPTVRAAVAANPAFPASKTNRLLRDRRTEVRAHLAARTDLSPRQLSWIERYSRADTPMRYRQIRWRLAQNPSCPRSLQRRLESIEHEIGTAAASGRVPTSVRWGFVLGGVSLAVLVATSIGCIASGTIDMTTHGFSVERTSTIGIGVLITGIAVRVVKKFRRHYPYTGPRMAPPRHDQAVTVVSIVSACWGAGSHEAGRWVLFLPLALRVAGALAFRGARRLTALRN